MTTTLTDFSSEVQLPTTELTIASTLSTERGFIGLAVFTNTSLSSVDVTIWRLQTATTGTTGSGGNWLKLVTIPPKNSYICRELSGCALGPAMKISALADTGSVINVNVSGTLES